MSSRIGNNVQRVSLVAFIVLMMAVLFGTITSYGFVPFAHESLELYACLVAYVVLAYKYDVNSRFGGWGRAAYFAVHLALFALVHRLGIPGNYLYLLAMPVVSQASAWIRWPGVAMVCLAYLVIMDFAYRGMKSDWEGTRTMVTSIVPAFVFVVAYSAVAKNAIVSRARAETLASELEMANAQLRASAEQSSALSAANERNRIARDIHDGVGHYLTVVTVQLQAARVLLAENPQKAEEAVMKAETMSRAALEEVRRSVGTLRSATTVPPLPDAIQRLIRESPVPAVLEVRGTVRCLPDAMEQAIFRAVQEGLTNACKHARATRVDVVLDFEAPTITRVAVADDGQGRCDGVSAGFGLVGIRERVDGFGGKFSARNRAGGGFLLELEVPA